MDENGRSWRSGALVEKRPLKQWFVRCTQYAQSLLDGLDKSELTDWRDVLAMQRSWIGPCNGTKLKFGLTGSNCESTSSNLWVWTDRPELIWGAAFVAITPEHILAKTHAGSNLPGKFQSLRKASEKKTICQHFKVRRQEKPYQSWLFSK